jgi:hypothetical protein
MRNWQSWVTPLPVSNVTVTPIVYHRLDIQGGHYDYKPERQNMAKDTKANIAVTYIKLTSVKLLFSFFCKYFITIIETLQYQ